MARGSMIAPDRMCAPGSEPFSSTTTETSLRVLRRQLLQANRGGQAGRAGADDRHVVLHRFARAVLGRGSRRRSLLFSWLHSLVDSTKARAPLMSYTIDLSGRVALVTGASSGLGAQFARVLARAGAGVALAGRRVERLKSLRAEIEAEGGDAHVVPLDVTDHDGIKAAVAHTETEVGTIDILVNNSGVATTQKLVDVTPEDFDYIFDVNVRGAFFVAQEVGKRMIARAQGAAPGTFTGGRIVNIASMAGLRVLGRDRRLRDEQGGGGAHDQGDGARVGPLRHQCQRASARATSTPRSTTTSGRPTPGKKFIDRHAAQAHRRAGGPGCGADDAVRQREPLRQRRHHPGRRRLRALTRRAEGQA